MIWLYRITNKKFLSRLNFAYLCKHFSVLVTKPYHDYEDILSLFIADFPEYLGICTNFTGRFIGKCGRCLQKAAIVG
jgi:hypothetical protein